MFINDDLSHNPKFLCGNHGNHDFQAYMSCFMCSWHHMCDPRPAHVSEVTSTGVRRLVVGGQQQPRAEIKT